MTPPKPVKIHSDSLGEIEIRPGDQVDYQNRTFLRKKVTLIGIGFFAENTSIAATWQDIPTFSFTLRTHRYLRTDFNISDFWPEYLEFKTTKARYITRVYPPLWSAVDNSVISDDGMSFEAYDENHARQLVSRLNELRVSAKFAPEYLDEVLNQISVKLGSKLFADMA